MRNLKINKFIKKTGYKVKQHSPEILMAAGVVGTVTSAVLACRATTKLNGILEESKNNIDTVKHYTENPEELPEGSEYNEEDGKKDLTLVYVQTGLAIAKLYAPSVILGALSITAMVSSNKILRKRNVALVASYKLLDKGFKDYRGRVVDRFGKDVDRELLFNMKSKEIEETVVDENGNETVVKKTVDVVDPTEYSPYAKFFAEGCKGYEKNAEANLLFLKAQQAFANERLKTEGYLFLNDVYESLGIPKTEMGQVVGWIYDESNPDIDSHVDFGIYNAYREVNANFVNGYERNILLDFNCDGYIADKI